MNGKKLISVFMAMAMLLAALTGVLAENTILRRIPVPAKKPEDAQPDDLAVHDHIPKKAIDVMTNFSYGLIVFGLGLVAVVLYLILRN